MDVSGDEDEEHFVSILLPMDVEGESENEQPR